jgi:hypothetical protein
MHTDLFFYSGCSENLIPGVRFRVSGKVGVKADTQRHHLLQKCSFFLIKLAVFLASGAARMKLHEMTNDD